ncbi:unnamed protein product, partial [Urochloa humidicola]
HCLVRWINVKRPKKLGGLGVLDLGFFSRALRLRWLWYQWTEPERPWVGAEVSCNDIDKALFRASTRVTVGNGARARFWESSWLDGQAPRDIAPHLYKLAWCKNNSVQEDLQEERWTRGLWRMSTSEEIAEYAILWWKLWGFQLNDQEDSISWKWTADGQYSAKSAYNIQFEGTFSSSRWQDIWKSKAEGKHRFFVWLFLQSKILTADRLMARHWPCDPICSLCDQAQETAEHLCLHRLCSGSLDSGLHIHGRPCHCSIAISFN